MQRFIVLEGGACLGLDAAVAELTDTGLRAVAGCRVPPDTPAGSVVCVARVATAEDASRALLVAVDGAHLVLCVDSGRDLVDQICDDLRRIGTVDHRVGSTPGPALSADERKLLALLLGGATLGEAARSLHLSRRTADRRLASARSALGAGSTPEALRIALDIGVRPAGA